MRRPVLMMSAAAAATLLLGACSSGSSGDSTAAATATSTAKAPAGANSQQQRGGISGEIAAITGSVLQVQSSDAQTAVGWSDSTTFTTTASGTIADIAVGSCVLAMGDSTVIVSTAVGGACTMGGFGGGAPGSAGAGGRPTDLPSGMPDGLPSGMPTDLPDGMPSDMPSGMPSGAPGGMNGGAGMSLAAGLVTAVDGNTITVAAADSASEPSTVTLASDAVISVQKSTDSSALAVGLCATVRGEADTKGQVAATSIALSTPGDSGCTTGWGMPGGGNRGGAGAPTDGTTAGDGNA